MHAGQAVDQTGGEQEAGGAVIARTVHEHRQRGKKIADSGNDPMQAIAAALGFVADTAATVVAHAHPPAEEAAADANH